MALSTIRIGNVTSSDVVDITKNGVGADTVGATFFSYVEDCRTERFAKQNISKEVDVFAMAWGKLCEIPVHKKLSSDYKFQSDKTIAHPKIAGLVGTPDGEKYKVILKALEKDAVTDIKCPTTIKAFISLISGLYNFDGVDATVKDASEIDFDEVVKKFRKKARDGEKFYQQLVSNSCIVGTEFAELIVFMPYFDDLEAIKLYNTTLKEPYFKVEQKKIEELPFITPESGLMDVNIIRFKVPVIDKQFLEMRARMATELISFSDETMEELLDMKGYNKEETIIKFIEEKTGEKITHVKRSAK